MGRRRTVLAAANDTEVLNILSVNLAYANVGVSLTRNAKDALVKARVQKPDLILLDHELPDMEIAELCRLLETTKETRGIPVILFGATGVENGTAAVDSIIPVPYEPKQVVDAVKANLKRLERAENANPLTGLPNDDQLIAELEDVIRKKCPFAAVYLDMDDLRTFNRKFGFASGDGVIRTVAQILCEAVRLFGAPEDLVAHLGGDNFVLVTSADVAGVICRKIIADFDAHIQSLDGEPRSEGRLHAAQPSVRRYPPLAIRAAIVRSEGHNFRDWREVGEMASHELESLRQFSGSNCTMDLLRSEDITGLSNTAGVRGRGGIGDPAASTLALVSVLAHELHTPLALARDSIQEQVAQVQSGAGMPFCACDILKHIERLSQIAEELTQVVGAQESADISVLDEAGIRNMLVVAIEQARNSIGNEDVQVDVEKGRDVGRLVVEEGTLAQALFYAFRGEFACAARGDRLRVEFAERNDGFIAIEIANGGLRISSRELAVQMQGRLEGMDMTGTGGDLWLAARLLHRIGGQAETRGSKGEGTCLSIIVPRRWSSHREDIAGLMSSAEATGNEARVELRRILNLSEPSGSGRLTEDRDLSGEGIARKIQELLVLCNRSLFMADDLSRRLEARQNQLVEHEVNQIAVGEAILIACRGIAASMHEDRLFDVNEGRTAAQTATAIAAELRLSRSERQTLYLAALLRELPSVARPKDGTHKGSNSPEEEVALVVRFGSLWKALSRIGFLSTPLTLAGNRQRCLDEASRAGAFMGVRLPLAESILDLADAFAAGLFASSSRGASHGTAMQEFLDESGWRLDPRAVMGFMRLWERGGITVGGN